MIERFIENVTDESRSEVFDTVICLDKLVAEYLHREVRTKHWGYMADESLSQEEATLRCKYILQSAGQFRL